mmetsp:Transcript_5869/g.10203  ORF Transcript_5869/g.10203 Transcript_5869/m.10203 type:complete len:255 (+) Transcript_5869:558-1322(+)
MFLTTTSALLATPTRSLTPRPCRSTSMVAMWLSTKRPCRRRSLRSMLLTFPAMLRRVSSQPTLRTSTRGCTRRSVRTLSWPRRSAPSPQQLCPGGSLPRSPTRLARRTSRPSLLRSWRQMRRRRMTSKSVALLVLEGSLRLAALTEGQFIRHVGTAVAVCTACVVAVLQAEPCVVIVGHHTHDILARYTQLCCVAVYAASRDRFIKQAAPSVALSLSSSAKGLGLDSCHKLSFFPLELVIARNAGWSETNTLLD